VRTRSARDGSKAILAPQVEHTFDDPAVLATWRALDAAARQPSETLSAGESFAAALNFNPQMALARAQIEAGQAGVLIAKQRPNPVLALTPEHLINAVAEGVSPWVVAISLVWPVRTAGKRALAIDEPCNQRRQSTQCGAPCGTCAPRCAAPPARSSRIRETALAHEEWDLRIDRRRAGGRRRWGGEPLESPRAADRDGAAQRLARAPWAQCGRHDPAAWWRPFAEIERRVVDKPAWSGGRRVLRTRRPPRPRLQWPRTDAPGRRVFAPSTPPGAPNARRTRPELRSGLHHDQAIKINFTVSGELPIFSQ
jgi:hypothetical protein